MKFSYNLLNKFVNLDNIGIEKLVNRLIFAGFEVEEYYPLASATNLVIGEIISCTSHPSSDHLHLLKVDCGKETGVLDIVCGAPNVKVGLHVIVAKVGAKLGHENIEIKESVIRGEKSCGMCCSLNELGVEKEFLNEKQVSGIEELPTSLKVGSTNVLELLHLNDYILDVNILPNRPDCLSYYGLAREIASLFEIKTSSIPKIKSLENKNQTKIETDKCSRFDLINIKNIKLKETPLEIKHYLIASGIRSISPLVDLGNYVMLLTGQPVNIYDLDKIEFPLRVIDKLKTKVVTFDEKEIEVDKGDLLICDNKKPVCIAGIMALNSAQVSKDTTSIAIEVACFDSKSIRYSSNKFGLVSFSSNLYSKGRNPLLIDECIATILNCLELFASDYKVGEYSSCVNNKLIINNKPFKFSIDNMNARLGSNYTKKDVDRVLKAYNIEVKEGKIIPPIYRTDLKESCDIEEEIFRFYPIDKLSINLDSYPINSIKKDNEHDNDSKITKYLVNNGYYQILPYTLIDEKLDKSVRVFNKTESYKVKNAMTKDHEIVRSDLIPSMLDVINYNVDHFHTDFKLFEISNLDTKEGNKKYISFGLYGKKYLTDKMKGVNFNFYDLKGDIFNILKLIGISESRVFLEYSKNEAFNPYASADIYIDKKLVGTFGQIHMKIEKNKYIVGELDLGALYELKTSNTKFTPFISNSIVNRELSFEIKDDISYEKLKKVISSNSIPDLKSVNLFDVYKDKVNNKEFYTVSLQFSNDEKTLNNNEIETYINKIIESVKNKLNIELRT